MTSQLQLAHKIKDLYKDADIKKVNKDNFVDIHLPEVYHKKGTHLFFNTARDTIKLGFYCRDEDFVKVTLVKSSMLERYSQGIRLKGNPEFGDIDEAVKAAVTLIQAITGKTADNSKPANSQSDKISGNKISDNKGLIKLSSQSGAKSTPIMASKSEANKNPKSINPLSSKTQGTSKVNDTEVEKQGSRGNQGDKVGKDRSVGVKNEIVKNEIKTTPKRGSKLDTKRQVKNSGKHEQSLNHEKKLTKWVVLAILVTILLIISFLF